MGDGIRTRAAVAVAALALVGSAHPHGQAANGWDDETHGRDAVPDYSRVFRQDRVNRLDIQVSPQDWQRLLSDMTEMAGPFGRGGGGAGFKPLQPSADAVAACNLKVEGDACSYGTPPTSGRCVQVPQSPLACLPLGPPAGGGFVGGPAMPGTGGPGAGGAQGADDVEFLQRTPIYIPATVTFENTVFRHVGLRLKGNSSLMNAWALGSEKLPFRLNFDELDQQFPEVRDQTFFGFPNLNLTNNAMDRSFLRAKVAGDMLREAGIPSARTAFVRVHMDRGAGPVYLGLYTLVEVPDRPMLVTQFGSDDGNLYKPRGEGGRWTRFIKESFPKKTNIAAEDWTDVEDAIAALNASRENPAAWRARLEARVAVDAFLRWLAFNTIIDNHDAYGGLSPHNYYLYGSPRHRDRLFWIPWDHDLAMGAGGGVQPIGEGPGGPITGGAPGDVVQPRPDVPAPGGGALGLDLFHDNDNASWPLIRFLMDDPVYRAAYRRHLEDILGTVFEPSRLGARLRSEHALIARDVVGPAGEQQGRTFLQTPQQFDDALYGATGLLAFIERQHAAVRQALGSAR